MKAFATTTALAIALALGVPLAATAQLSGPRDPSSTATPTPAPTGGAPATAASADAAAARDAQDDDPDKDINRAQPDFTLVGLPTTLRLPRHSSAFRISHRFGRPLGQGSFSDLLQDGFGFDSGAVIGFEYRYGLFKATQLVVHRTNNRTIQFLLQREITAQSASFPVTIDLLGSAEGTNNFRDTYSPGVGLVVSREIGDRAALYAEPFWVNNTNPLPGELADDNDSVMVGLGLRLRLSSTVYGVFEITPRVAGFDPGEHQVAFAVEKRAGGHSFQLNFGNAFGTTFAQMARGGNDDWYLGFNITRKFY